MKLVAGPTVSPPRGRQVETVEALEERGFGEALAYTSICSRFLTWSSCRVLLLLAFAVVSFVCLDAAQAERLFFRSYGASEGLTSLGGTCLSQVGPGYLLVCSEHGVFSYDGRTFTNLGSAQGLIEGGVVYDLATTTSGRIAVRFPDRLFVSDGPVTSGRPPASMSFSQVDLRGASVFDEYPKQMASFADGLAMIIGRRTMRITLRSSGGVAEPMSYNATEQAALDSPIAVFSIGGHLWETFKDGRMCSADPGSVRCYGPPKELVGGPWQALIAGPDGSVLARSEGFLATLDTRSGSLRVEALPDQGGEYESYPRSLGLFHSPAGEVVTQSAHGLIIREASGWSRLGADDSVPSGMITSVLADRSGQLWIQVFGRGLFRGLGYGQWEALQQEDGLSEGVAWQTVRTANGSLWVSTDTGVDEVRRFDDTLRVVRVIPGASYALAVEGKGLVWATDSQAGAKTIDPSKGLIEALASPVVGAIAVGDDQRVWLGTEHGLFRAEERSGKPPLAVPDGAGERVVEVSSDGSGGAWYLSGGRLWHRRSDGRHVFVSGRWPSGEFEPLAMAIGMNGHVWVGGAGGLYDMTVIGDRVVAIDGVPQSGIGRNTVVAVTLDRRGWVWAGTGRGITAFDGHRWVSADAGTGLVWDDVSQGGIYDDPDGSIWIATSQGISHLLHPAWLFSEHPVHVAISRASLGQTVLRATRVRYSVAPLSVQFGTFSYASERSIVFRYRMSGVDDGWAESTTGSVRYASVPPGRHVLTVTGYNVLSHVVSDPVTLTIDMGFPWWRTWSADLIYLLIGSSAFYAILKARERAVLRVRERATRQKQSELEFLVEERTRDMRIAQAELRRLATLDGLTGLLNRTEVERRLADRLKMAGTPGEMLIAMIDIDHFKQINDSHGHLVGDDILRALGVRVFALLRDGEFAGRYGGEEMLIILDDRDGCGAERALRYHQVVRQAPFHARGVSVPVTCSVGLAWAAPGDDWEALVGRADAALYEAKRLGRDRVVESADAQAGPFTQAGGSGRPNGGA